MQREADFAPSAECLILSDFPLLPLALQRLSMEPGVWDSNAIGIFLIGSHIKIKHTLSR